MISQFRFLETTAAAARIFGLPETRKKLNEICAGNPLISSIYVWDEFRRTFIHDAVICHTILLNSMVSRHETLREGLQRIARNEQIFTHPRRLSRSWDICAFLHEPPLISLADAVDRLEKMIRYDLKRFFFTGLDLELKNATQCCKTEMEPRMTPSPDIRGYPKFEIYSRCSKKDRPNCDIVSFWKGNQIALQKIVQLDISQYTSTIVKKEMKVLQDEASFLLNALQDPSRHEEAYGTHCYAVLADLIITLECPRDVPIVTSNTRHFETICEAIEHVKPLGFALK